VAYRDVGAFDSFAQRAHSVAAYPAGTLPIDDYLGLEVQFDCLDNELDEFRITEAQENRLLVFAGDEIMSVWGTQLIAAGRYRLWTIRARYDTKRRTHAVDAEVSVALRDDLAMRVDVLDPPDKTSSYSLPSSRTSSTWPRWTPSRSRPEAGRPALIVRASLHENCVCSSIQARYCEPRFDPSRSLVRSTRRFSVSNCQGKSRVSSCHGAGTNQQDPVGWMTATKNGLRDVLRDRLKPTFEACCPVKERMAEPPLADFAFDGKPFYGGWSGFEGPASVQADPVVVLRESLALVRPLARASR